MISNLFFFFFFFFSFPPRRDRQEQYQGAACRPQAAATSTQEVERGLWQLQSGPCKIRQDNLSGCRLTQGQSAPRTVSCQNGGVLGKKVTDANVYLVRNSWKTLQTWLTQQKLFIWYVWKGQQVFWQGTGWWDCNFPRQGPISCKIYFANVLEQLYVSLVWNRGS